jgi:hypothetical protein
VTSRVENGVVFKKGAMFVEGVLFMGAAFREVPGGRSQ